MFERFSVSARHAVVLARDEAVRAGGNAIGCEHLLLALLNERHGAAGQALTAAGLDLTDLRARVATGMDGARKPLDAEALASLGIDLDTVRRATEAAFGRGALDRAARPPRTGRTPGGLHLTADAKKSLQLALLGTVRVGQREITSGQLLIGIIDQKENTALRLLAAAGVDAASLRADVLARLTTAA
jgi:ATP-dependent Clp protease ATP-binding subunit ClpA